MSGGSSTWRGVAAVAVLVGVTAFAGMGSAGGAQSRGIFPDDSRSRLVSCKFAPETGTLLVTVRERRIRIRLPRGLPDRIRRQIRQELTIGGSATIQRRGDQITILEGEEFFYETEGAPLPCGGGATVGRVDEIRVRRGKNTRSADLHLDLAYGQLEPGATDEGDGSSEIELNTDLGPGYVFLRMTRGADAVAVTEQAGAKAINLNASELTPDVDLTAGRQTELQIDGAGSGDQLSAAGGPAGPELVFGEAPAALGGSQGSDTLIGGEGSQALYGLAGSDLIEAGDGSDFVYAAEHAPDRVDCGPGRDLAVIRGTRDRIRDCELRLSPRELFEIEEGDVEESASVEVVVISKNRSRKAQAERAASALRRFRAVAWLSARHRGR